ncbi:TIGR02556 family CRISPR-associated protein, partial [Candidatus Parcubacteria bacterium]|nr:TIGR02556 family CRISPR-associated protein [Candidatus Parcubacteria bacterium]
IREIRNEFVNNGRFEYLTLYSLFLYLFLLELGLVGGEKMEEQESEVVKKPKNNIKEIKKFFEKFNYAFDKPEKKAVFLEGVLTRFLLDWQYATRGSTPFKAKLYSLNLDEQRIKKLLVDLESKLMEYDLQYSQLKELIAMYLVEAGNNWNLSKDEISYYFVLGLSLGRMFKSETIEGHISGGDMNE